MYNFRQARKPQAATTTEAHNEYAAFGIVKRHVSGCDTANMELPYGNIRNDSSAHETHDIAHTANGHHEDKGAAYGKPPHYTARGRRGGPPALQPAQRQTDAGASLCSMRRFTACTLPSAINDFQIEPGVRRPNATARHAKQHGTACKTARPCMQNSTARHNRPCPSNAPIDSRHVASLHQVQPQAFCTMG